MGKNLVRRRRPTLPRCTRSRSPRRREYRSTSSHGSPEATQNETPNRSSVGSPKDVSIEDNKLKDVQPIKDSKEAANSETTSIEVSKKPVKRRLPINYGHNEIEEAASKPKKFKRNGTMNRLPKELFKDLPLLPRPRFVLPLKNLIMRQMKHLTATIKTDPRINTKFFQIIRKCVRLRLADVLKGRKRMQSKEIVALYREYFPVETDERLVECIKQGVLAGFYDDITHSDLDEDIDTGAEEEKKETKDDEMKPVEKQSETSQTQELLVNSEAVNIDENAAPQLNEKVAQQGPEVLSSKQEGCMEIENPDIKIEKETPDNKIENPDINIEKETPENKITNSETECPVEKDENPVVEEKALVENI